MEPISKLNNNQRFAFIIMKSVDTASKNKKSIRSTNDDLLACESWGGFGIETQ